MRSNSPSYGFLFAVFILLSLVAFVPGQTSRKVAKAPHRPRCMRPPVHRPILPSTSARRPARPAMKRSTTAGRTPHWKTTLDTKSGPSHQGCEALPRPWRGARGGRRRQNQDIRLRRASRQNQRPLPDLPRRRTSAGPFSESAHPAATSAALTAYSPHHAKKPHSAGPGPAPAMLRVPYFRQSRLRQTLSPPRERGYGAVQRLP